MAIPMPPMHPWAGSFSAAASLGPIVLSRAGQESIYLQVKQTFLEFYTKEQKDAKCGGAKVRSLSLDSTRSTGQGTTSSQCFSFPQASDNDSTSVSAAAETASQSSAQQLQTGTWDVSSVANILDFVPQPTVFMVTPSQHADMVARSLGYHADLVNVQSWHEQVDQQAAPQTMKEEAQEKCGGGPTPLRKKQLQKKDLSELGNNGDATQATTVMVRGIPCSFTQDRMFSLLNEVGLEGKFNFFYLPYAGKSSSNLGYAFVNFVDTESVATCMASLDGVPLDPARSVKLCAITPADIQGLENLRKHFRRAAVSRSNRGPMFLKVPTESS